MMRNDNYNTLFSENLNFSILIGEKTKNYALFAH